MSKRTYSPEQITTLLAQIVFDERGLIPVIAQESASGQVLMLAWMNAEALQLTMTSGDVTYWSRSRQELWRKGATSGHVQVLHNIALDCDGDALLLQITQTGAACHTGAPSCFFKEV